MCFACICWGQNTSRKFLLQWREDVQCRVRGWGWMQSAQRLYFFLRRILTCSTFNFPTVLLLLEQIEFTSKDDCFNSYCFWALLSHLPCQGSGRHPLSRADVAVSWWMVDELLYISKRVVGRGKPKTCCTNRARTVLDLSTSNFTFSFFNPLWNWHIVITRP